MCVCLSICPSVCLHLYSYPRCSFPYQVQEYAAVFWERKDELEDHDRIMALIEKGEQKIQRKKDIRNALETKVSPLTEQM